MSPSRDHKTSTRPAKHLQLTSFLLPFIAKAIDLSLSLSLSRALIQALLFCLLQILSQSLKFLPVPHQNPSPLLQAPSLPSPSNKIMTRSHKHNDRDHSGLADGTAEPEQHLPRYFAKHGHVDADPKKTKKDGAGKGNWGRDGDEIEDGPFNLAKPRRRSNSSADHAKDFKTKFETIEQEPVFEEELHGDGGEDHYSEEHEHEQSVSGSSEGIEVDKQSTSESSVSSV